MSLPYSVILIPFGLVLLVWAGLSIVAIVKMMRFGFLSRSAVMSTFFYAAFCAIVLVLAVSNLRDVDWSSQYTVGTPSLTLPSLQHDIPKVFTQ